MCVCLEGSGMTVRLLIAFQNAVVRSVSFMGIIVCLVGGGGAARIGGGGEGLFSINFVNR